MVRIPILAELHLYEVAPVQQKYDLLSWHIESLIEYELYNQLTHW